MALRQAFGREKVRLLFSLVLVALLFALTYLVFTPGFETNDDMDFMYVTAGYTTGAPYAANGFSSVIWGAPVALLYRLLPGVAWYSVGFIALMMLSCVCILKSVLKATAKAGLPPLLGAAYLALHVLTVLFFSVMLQFTFVPALCGAAASVLLLASSRADGPKTFALDLALFTALTLALLAIRQESGYIQLGFLAIVAVYRLIRDFAEKRQLKRVIAFVCAAVLMQGACLGVKALYERGDEAWSAYYAFSAARHEFMSIAGAPYDEAAEVYESLGWDEPMVEVTRDWFMYDERLTTEALQTVNDYNWNEWAGRPGATFSGSVSAAFARLWAAMREMLVWPFLVCCFIAVWGCVRFALQKKWLDALWILACPAAFMAVSFLISFTQQRMPVRVAASILLPAAAFTLLFFFRSLEGFTFKKKPLNAAIGLALCLLVGYGGLRAASETRRFAVENPPRQAVRLQVDQYCIGHPDNIYLADNTFDKYVAGPFTVFTGGVPSNYFFYGSRMNSPSYFAQIAANGRQSLESAALLEDGVYHLSGIPPEDFGQSAMNIYMMQDKGAAGFEVVDGIADGAVWVYKFY